MRKLTRKETSHFAAWVNGDFLISQTADDRFVISSRKGGEFVKMVDTLWEAEQYTNSFPKHGVKLRRGEVYTALTGGRYLCRHGGDGCPTLQNVESGYTFRAEGITMYPGGRIEWKSSTHGRFEKVGGNYGKS